MKNGNPLKICNYINGELNGEYKKYHENGNHSFECNYINGELNGIYKEYYSIYYFGNNNL